MKLKKGLQISADFFDCSYSLNNPNKLEKVLKHVLGENGIHILKASSYTFPNNGATILFLLSESHFAIHTWPEKGLINLDLFLCNYESDNRLKVKNTFRDLKKLFVPKKISTQHIARFT